MARVIFLTDLSEEYGRRLLRGFTRYVQETDEAWSIYRMPLSIREKYGIEEVVRWAQRMKVNAVIGQFHNTDNVDLFRQNGIIAIAQDFKKRFSSIPNITGPHYQAGQMCAEYFIKKGFRNFAFYGTRNIEWADERCAGFRETVSASNPEFSFSALRSRANDTLWYYDPTKIAMWLQALPKPVAIMACDDNQAYHIVEACRLVGGGNCRIPDDIAVLGVDNDETMCLISTPNLSSLNQGVEQGGYDVARLIDRLIKDPEAQPEDVIVMPTHIVTRQSTDIYANNDPHISRVLKYIHENITQKLLVPKLVEQVPLSRRLLEKRFRNEMGTSIYNYIVSVRIEKMAQMLSEGSNVSEAAAELGFADIKNLSRMFRQMKGMSPSEYRDRYAARQM